MTLDVPVGAGDTACVEENLSFRAPWWLPGGHLTTIWSYVVQRAPRPPYRRERMETDDGDFLDLDWIDGPTDAPLVVAHHGLEGGSSSPYMRRLMSRIAERGWRGLALNARGCSGEDNRKAITYHSGFTDDLARVVTRVAAREPDTTLLLAGYSLGGSIVANYLSKRADEVPSNVRAAFLCSTPLRLAPGVDALEYGFNRMYGFRFLRTLKRKVVEKARQHPEWKEASQRAARARTLRAFDDTWVASVYGFQDADDYYAQSSAADHLGEVRLPTAVLHAADDPFVIPACVPEQAVAAAPHVELLWTSAGGHVGFLHGTERHWLEDVILGWLDAHR